MSSTSHASFFIGAVGKPRFISFAACLLLFAAALPTGAQVARADAEVQATTSITPEQQPATNIESAKEEYRDTPVDTQIELVIDKKPPELTAPKK